MEDRRKHHRFRILWISISQWMIIQAERSNMRWLSKFLNNYAATDWDALKLIAELLALLIICTIFTLSVTAR